MGGAVGILGHATWALLEADNYYILSEEHDFYFNRGINTLYIAMGVDLEALIPALIVMVRGENWMPLQQAYAVAEDYNKQLLKSLD